MTTYTVWFTWDGGRRTFLGELDVKDGQTQMEALKSVRLWAHLKESDVWFEKKEEAK